MHRALPGHFTENQGPPASNTARGLLENGWLRLVNDEHPTLSSSFPPKYRRRVHLHIHPWCSNTNLLHPFTSTTKHTMSKSASDCVNEGLYAGIRMHELHQRVGELRCRNVVLRSSRVVEGAGTDGRHGVGGRGSCLRDENSTMWCEA